MNKLDYVAQELHRIRIAWEEAKAPFIKHLVLLESCPPIQIAISPDGETLFKRIELDSDSETKRLLYEHLDYMNKRCLAECKEFAERYGVSAL